MSLIVAVAPASKRPPIATPEQIKAFKELHEADVVASINLMLRKIKPGVNFRQIVTPLRAAVHDECATHVREDFSRIGCPNSILMRALFREKCTKEMGIEMSFDFETSLLTVPDENNPEESHKELVIQMIVNSYISVKQPRTSRKKR